RVGLAVIDPEGEAVGPAIIIGRRVSQCAGAGVEAADDAMGGRRDDGVRQGTVFHVGARQGNGLGGVLGSSDTLAVGHGRVVHWCHRDADGGYAAVGRAVVDAEGETITAVEVCVGRV